MDRRKFIRNGSLTGIGLTTVGGWSRTYGTIGSDSTKRATALDLEEITIQELQSKMQSGEESSVSITKAYLERIKEIDKAGPDVEFNY